MTDSAYLQFPLESESLGLYGKKHWRNLGHCSMSCHKIRDGRLVLKKYGNRNRSYINLEHHRGQWGGDVCVCVCLRLTSIFLLVLPIRHGR
jgi:hypothetical protein